MALNKVILVGRTASDLELKQTPSGKSVCTFSIAIRKDENTADFFTIVAWEKNAEFASKHFRKGDGIGIEGRLSARSYEKDGVKHTVYEVLCDRVFFTEGAKREESTADTNSTAYNPYDKNTAVQGQFQEIPSQDGLPF